MRRIVIAFMVFATGALGACIIGPKQDDPAGDEAVLDSGTAFDASFTSETGSTSTLDGSTGGDTSLPPAPPDADADADADAASDAAGDSAPDVVSDAADGG